MTDNGRMRFHDSIEQEDAKFYDKAKLHVIENQNASISFVQRHLMCEYNRAARLVERMEEEGIISKPNAVGKREVLVKP